MELHTTIVYSFKTKLTSPYKKTELTYVLKQNVPEFLIAIYSKVNT